jgi:hypothetical protein
MAAEARAAARRSKAKFEYNASVPKGEEKPVPFQVGDELVFDEGPHRILQWIRGARSPVADRWCA